MMQQLSAQDRSLLPKLEDFKRGFIIWQGFSDKKRKTSTFCVKR